MTKRHLALSLALGLALAFSAAACGKAPAEAALNAVQAAFDAANVDAAAYVPDQVKGVEDSLAAAKATLADGDYAKVMTDAKALSQKVTLLTEAANAKKAELTTNWGQLSAGLPETVASIRTRMESLSAARRLPAGVTAEAVAGAKTSLDSLGTMWTEATTAFGSGNLVAAVGKAQAVKAKVVEVMTGLGMPVPDMLK